MRCGEILPLDPFGEAELLPVDRELIRAVKLGEEANEEGIRERPGLVRDVGKIAHGKAYLLLDFAPAALLQGLAYLSISCDERMVCDVIRPPAYFVRSRRSPSTITTIAPNIDARIDDVSARGADKLAGARCMRKRRYTGATVGCATASPRVGSHNDSKSKPVRCIEEAA